MSEQEQYLSSLLPENNTDFSKTNISKLFKALFSMDFEIFHCEESTVPDMKMKVSGGRFTLNGVYKEWSLDGNKDVTTTNTATATAPTTNPRIDIHYWDTSSETLGVVTGTEAATPSQPTMPDPVDKIPFKLVYHRVGSTKILNSDDATNSYIMGREIRPFLSIGLGKLAAALNCQDKEVQRALLKDYAEKLTTVAAAGATETLDIENGNAFNITLDEACTLTFSNPIASGNMASFTLMLRQDGTGGFATTWPASVDWADGSAPTLITTASSVTILCFITVDGGTIWHGFVGSSDSK